jgi:hypothetical protein
MSARIASGGLLVPSSFHRQCVPLSVTFAAGMGGGVRYEKADNLLQLALEMQAARAGLSLADIQEKFRVGRRTAMRMRDAVLRNFAQAEEVETDERVKRWRLPSGTLDRLINFTADELAALEGAIRLMDRDNREDEAASLTTLSGKLRALLRPEVARKVEPDLEAMLEAEGLAMRPGPRPRIKVPFGETGGRQGQGRPAARGITRAAQGRWR